MNKYIIEREVAGAGKLPAEELQAIAQKSKEVLGEMGTDIVWVESYITADKIFCVYFAENEELVLEHAKKGGFPADKISKVATVIDLTTANAAVAA